MNSATVLSALQAFIHKAWCWWRLYTRLPQRMAYHLGDPPPLSSLSLGKSAAHYALFESAFWLVLFQIPLGRLFSIDSWLFFYFLLFTVIAIRECQKWLGVDNSIPIKNCNVLRHQGFWYPAWMTVSLKKRALWQFIFVILQMLLTAAIVISSMYFFT